MCCMRCVCITYVISQQLVAGCRANHDPFNSFEGTVHHRRHGVYTHQGEVRAVPGRKVHPEAGVPPLFRCGGCRPPYQ